MFLFSSGNLGDLANEFVRVCESVCVYSFGVQRDMLNVRKEIKCFFLPLESQNQGEMCFLSNGSQVLELKTTGGKKRYIHPSAISIRNTANTQQRDPMREKKKTPFSISRAPRV